MATPLLSARLAALYYQRLETRRRLSGQPLIKPPITPVSPAPSTHVMVWSNNDGESGSNTPALIAENIMGVVSTIPMQNAIVVAIVHANRRPLNPCMCIHAAVPRTEKPRIQSAGGRYTLAPNWKAAVNRSVAISILRKLTPIHGLRASRCAGKTIRPTTIRPIVWAMSCANVRSSP